MLLAASESAVTKKPRLRLTRRRSSSDSAVGSFHCAMSRDMFTSCGIQWLAQPARYFSHAHLYLKGTSWFTSVAPLITRLSAACTRRGGCIDNVGPDRRSGFLAQEGRHVQGLGGGGEIFFKIQHRSNLLWFL